MPATLRSSAGQEAIDLALRAGLELDPWQQFILRQGMGEDADGRWAAFEICVNVPRQNGKGGVAEARELWGLFIGGEELILHSAHEFKTAMQAYKRIERLIRQTPDLHKRVKQYRKTVGQEYIELHSGQVLRFIARSRGSGRGFTGDCNVMDEDMFLGDDEMDALGPTMSAIDDPQIWYLGSAGVGAPSVQLARLRRRALAAAESGTPDPSLVYLEWSIDPHVQECPPDCADHDDPASDEAVLKSNPGIGYRLTLEKTENERRMMSTEGFARERLGVGSYPVEEEDGWRIVSEDAWRALTDHTSQMVDPVAFAVDVTPERSHAAICSASVADVPGRDDQGQEFPRIQIEVPEHRPGTGWVVERLMEMVGKHKPCAVAVDKGGPAASLMTAIRTALEERGLGHLLVEMTTRDVAAAYGQFIDAIGEERLAHLDQAPVATALAGADRRAVGDGWAWARRGVQVDISPLVGVTHAAWAHGERAHLEPEGAPNLW
ncbi:terminase [Streptomyces sp. NPDC059255]|uniref:terminase n=1 Tax=Streptomyces sp. NPDC059255 TaxID=3346793 RepID=UPI0036C125A2